MKLVAMIVSCVLGMALVGCSAGASRPSFIKPTASPSSQVDPAESSSSSELRSVRGVVDRVTVIYSDGNHRIGAEFTVIDEDSLLRCFDEEVPSCNRLRRGDYVNVVVHGEGHVHAMDVV